MPILNGTKKKRRKKRNESNNFIYHFNNSKCNNTDYQINLYDKMRQKHRGNRERGSVWTVYICYFLYIGGRFVYLVESNNHRTC